MAVGAWMSIQGLYDADPNVFFGFRVPSGIMKSTVVNTILLECAELEFLYPEPRIAQRAITLWTEAELPIWTELEKTKHYEYDPIANVDAQETEQRNLTGIRNGINTGHSNRTGSVSAFNSDGFQNRDQDTGSYADQNQDSWTDGGSITKTRHGNIGVTMTQQLINAQRDVVQFDIIQYIVDSFKQRFCLLVY